MTRCFSKLPGARPPPVRTPFEFWKVLPIQEGATVLPMLLPGPHLSTAGSSPAGLRGSWHHRGGRSGLGSCSSFPWPRDRLPLCPPFPSCCSPRPGARDPLRRARHCLTSLQATLGCAVPRSAPSSGFIPLLGRKEEPRGRKETQAGVWAFSRPRSPLGEGMGARGSAAEIRRPGWS